MKSLYVRLVRLVRRVAASTGLLALLDAWARRSRTGLWVRSWFSIFDLPDLLALDVPWWTFAAADEASELLADRPGARVWEWGSGASTLWLARRAGSVRSVEHDPTWAVQVEGMLPPHATLEVVPPVVAGDPSVPSRKAGFEGLDFTDYVAAIDRAEGTFDLVVVDGRAREACLGRALDRLAPGGMVVLDNVDRARYRDAVAREAERWGDRLQVLWTRGRTPALPYPTRTALLRLRDTDDATP